MQGRDSGRVWQIDKGVTMRRLMMLFGMATFALVTASGSIAAQEATPTVYIVPMPELCTLEPVSLGKLQEVLSTSDAETATASDSFEDAKASPTPFKMPTGEPVDETTRNAVEESMIVNVACINTGIGPQILAVYSNAGIRWVLRNTGLSPEQIYEQLSTPTALEEGDWTSIVEFQEMVRLPDGRVAAVVVGDDPTSEDGPSPTLFTLSERDGHWYIDEFVKVKE
jgi:hypothetical protein